MVSCLCCAVPTIVVQLITTAIALVYGKRWLLGKRRKAGMLHRIVTILLWIVVSLLALVAVSLVVLQSHAGLRSRAFASFCTYMGLKSSELDAYRCPLLQEHIRGNVVEFGPGPGTNFRCLAANATVDGDSEPLYAISSYVTVDPNPNFDAVRQQEKDRWNLTFPLVSVGLRGEDVDIERGIYHTVIGTHVLCSVDSPMTVLAAMDRALAPGGRYVFLEHVLADPKEQKVLRWLQDNIFSSLVSVVADGCKFMDVAALIQAQFGHGDNERYTVEITSLQAPGVPPFMAPHIVGVVTKK